MVRNKQRGSALISAMLLMSIVTLLAVGMITRQDVEIRRSDSLFTQERMLAQIAWVELWGVQVLSTVANQLTPENDYITSEQIWTLPLEEFQREGLWLSGEIIDLQGRFNLNNIIIPTGQAAEDEPAAQENTQTTNQLPGQQTRPNAAEEAAEEKILTPADFLTEENLFTPAWAFARFITNQAKITEIQGRVVTETLLYWMLPEQTDIDNYYLELPQPYRAAHQAFRSVSELRLVQGMDNIMYTAIQPYVTALPVAQDESMNAEISTVNVNTTTPEVLAAILNIDVAQANNIIGMRPYFNSESLQDQIKKSVTQAEGAEGNASQMLGITSNYFLVRAVVRNERRKMVQYSVLHRDAEGKISVIRRVQGEM